MVEFSKSPVVYCRKKRSASESIHILLWPHCCVCSQNSMIDIEALKTSPKIKLIEFLSLKPGVS